MINRAEKCYAATQCTFHIKRIELVHRHPSVSFKYIPKSSLSLVVSSFTFSWLLFSIPVHRREKRGTLKILPFAKDCVFDCIDKLCRHPVDPILRSFCWTQLKCLQKRGNGEYWYTECILGFKYYSLFKSTDLTVDMVLTAILQEMK